ncbi:MAG: hypothetical protein ACJ74Q_15595 [Pyrinomonadaceae bacterium]
MTRGDVLFIMRDGTQHRCHVGADGYPAAMVPFLREVLGGLREAEAKTVRKIRGAGPFFSGPSSGKDYVYYYVVDARPGQIEVSEDTLEGGEPVTWTAEQVERALAENPDCATIIRFPEDGGSRGTRRRRRSASA